MATAINLVLLVVGLIAFKQLELRHMPNMAQNEITITTLYPGGNSLTVEQRVTKPLEDALSGLDGIRKLSSESSDGVSQIHIKFKSSSDPKRALSEVRDRVYGVQSGLPDTVKRPEIWEASENNRSVLQIKFEDKSRSLAALSDYIRRVIEDRLRLIEGVSGIERWGNKLYQVTVQLDAARLAEQQVTAADVVSALKREKTFASGGEIEKSSGKETIVLIAEMTVPEEYKDVTVKQMSNKRVKLQDVADIQVTEKPTYVRMRIDGEYQIGLSVSVKPQANPLEVVERVRTFIADLQKNLPPTMKVAITFDATRPFESAIQSVQHTLWEAIILVGIIIILSLGSVRAALLPMLTVPLCLIGSFALMWGFGFSINPITLLALVLSVGLVVDDAIVVVENIHRHMESGLSALQAARKGMKEITFAVIVMTITLAAVYVPVAFQTDDSAVMFREFAWTLAGSVIISGFVALTLTPALCGKFLLVRESGEGESLLLTVWDKLNQRYRIWLNTAIKNPGKICVLAIFVAGLGVWGFNRLPSELMPLEDEDEIKGYIYADNAVMDSVRESWFKDVENILKTIPERSHYTIWEYQQRWISWGLMLKPRKERSVGTKDIMRLLQPQFKNIVGPIVGLDAGGSLDPDAALKIIVQYSGDYQRLLDAIGEMKREIKNFPEFQNLRSEELQETTRVKLTVDRPLAAEMGVSIEAIEDTLYTFLSGKHATDFSFQGFDYEVVVRAAPSFRREWEGMNQFFVASGGEEQRDQPDQQNQSQWVPLGSLVSIKEVIEPNKIKHYDRMRGAALSATLNPDVDLGEAMMILEPIVQKHLPKDARYQFDGKAQQYRDSKQAMNITYGLALVFIFLVLTALFESFIHPFIVLLTVPLSITGAVWVVNMMGGTNNIYTAIGLITLVGLITKHGILIVDFSNRLFSSGIPIREAVLEAASRRLRPVLMTTFAMVFGAIPLLFSLGAGALARQHIGWVVIGGMLCGTVFSLFVIPVVYLLVNRREDGVKS